MVFMGLYALVGLIIDFPFSFFLFHPFPPHVLIRKARRCLDTQLFLRYVAGGVEEKEQ